MGESFFGFLENFGDDGAFVIDRDDQGDFLAGAPGGAIRPDEGASFPVFTHEPIVSWVGGLRESRFRARRKMCGAHLQNVLLLLLM